MARQNPYPLDFDSALIQIPPDSGEPPCTYEKLNEHTFALGVSSNDYLGILPTKKSETPSFVPYSSKSKNGISHAVDYKTRLKQIEWSRGYLWDCHFSKRPDKPFNDPAFGLPVIDVTDAVAIGQSYDMNAGISTYRFPYRKTFFDIKMTFLDNEDGVMETYFENWFDEIYQWQGLHGSDNGTMNYLTTAVRELKVAKLSTKRREIFSRKYLVYPEGTIYGYNNNESNVRSFSVILVVAGYLGRV